MKLVYRTFLFVLQFAIIGLACAYVVTQFAPQLADRLRESFGFPPNAAPQVIVHSTPPQVPERGELYSTLSGPVSYADAVAHAGPAVVNIYANKVITGRLVSPDQLLVQRLFGGRVNIGPAIKQRRQSLGSGVIFSADGYVLTNNHVILGADEIQMLLYDNRVAQAHVVGSDAETDLAVLKIDALNLPTIAVANKPVTVGDVVLAIGNPFGFGKTVTMGIVSATGRQLMNATPYEDFIQTDAAINEGNSGGALVNAHGELVGINTANYRQNPGAEGIGFAIPVGTAKTVLDQIIDHGMVIRGWLGAEYTNVPVAANSGLPAAARGVLVQDIYANSPAALAGLQPGDVLLQLNDELINDQNELRTREAALPPGTKVKITGLRAGSPFSVEVSLVQRPVFNTNVTGG